MHFIQYIHSPQHPEWCCTQLSNVNFPHISLKIVEMEIAKNVFGVRTDGYSGKADAGNETFFSVFSSAYDLYQCWHAP